MIERFLPAPRCKLSIFPEGHWRHLANTARMLRHGLHSVMRWVVDPMPPVDASVRDALAQAQAEWQIAHDAVVRAGAELLAGGDDDAAASGLRHVALWDAIDAELDAAQRLRQLAFVGHGASTTESGSP